MIDDKSVIEKFSQYPISEVAKEVCASLAAHSRLIVTAPPGAGKSTLLPLVLLEQMHEGKILMLEPRRLAARQVALRMAAMLGEDIGETVGYRVRFDTCVSDNTQIEVITEGILERMLIDDPTLEGVSIVIFDEYHERSLSSDLSLCLVREIQNLLRPDLQILVMSATIDGDALSEVLDAPFIHSPGKIHEVAVEYDDDFEFHECALVVSRKIVMAFNTHKGNILAFLPGQAEILKCRELLGETIADAEIFPLYGNMPQELQQKVMSPPGKGLRRIVLASPIAETSLTIEGITVVIDSGLYRTPVYEPSKGFSRLVTTRISKDMATQRAGRAGRLMPGVCYRLWSKATESRMKEGREPEILSVDLSSMMLTLSAWGEHNPGILPWVTPPPEGHLAEAKRLLKILGVIDEKGDLTVKGKDISRLPCHPRIASMLIEAKNQKALACDIAAILEERDPCRDEKDADITTRILLLQQYRRGKMPNQWKRIDAIAAQYRRLVKASSFSGITAPEEIGSLLAKSYPERIALRDESGKYRLANGGNSLALHPSDDLARYEFLAVGAMGSRIFMAAPISRDTVESMGRWKEVAVWSNREGRAIVREELRLGQLTLASRQAKGNTRELICSAVAAAALKEGLTMFDFNDDVKELQLRIGVVSSWHPELEIPDVSIETILSTAKEWLPLYIGQASTVQELRKIDIRNVILGMLDYEQQQTLDKIAPTHIKLPSGRNARIRYRRGAEAPIVSARLQDCFGLLQTPRVDDGRRPVLMELLSPGFKPVQLTQDMEGFWRETYFEVRKELRRRYPKHSWPENPIG